MDNKEKILAVSKVLRRWFGIGFDKQMTPAREVIEALPSDKEIARGLIEEDKIERRPLAVELEIE